MLSVSALAGGLLILIVPIISIALWWYYAAIGDNPRLYLYKQIPILFLISTASLFTDCIADNQRTGYPTESCIYWREHLLILPGAGVIVSLLFATAEAAFGRMQSPAGCAGVVAMMTNVPHILLFALAVLASS